MSDRTVGKNARRGDAFGVLLGPLLERPDIFKAQVLPWLTVKDHFALAGVNRACRGSLAEVEGVDWLRRHGEAWSGMSTPYRVQVEACSRAAHEGRLEVLQWLRAKGCEWNAVTCSVAAGRGHLDVLRWARANGCEWDTGTCSAAARGGHLAVLEWAREKGCE